MLTSINFYRYITSDAKWDSLFSNHKIVFIQIMNGKGSQINELVNGSRESLIQDVNESGEISAVLKTITSIAGLPQYFNAQIKTSERITYVPISLPYYITQEDIEAHLGTTVVMDKVESWITKNNQWIDDVRQLDTHSPWETAEPPLARLISEPAYNYMKAVIEDGRVFKEL
jgi:hypothetical protein